MKTNTIVRGKDNTPDLTKQLKDSIVLESYGIQHKNFAENFREWIVLTGTNKDRFEELVNLAVVDYGPYTKGKTTLSFDGHALILTINDIEIFWDAYVFEDWVYENITLPIEYDDFRGTSEPILAKQFLDDEWEGVCQNFILDSLTNADIEDDELEDLKEQN